MDSRPADYEFSSFRVETLRRRLLRDGQLVPLTPKVFDTLLFLIERRGVVVTKDEMLAALWPDATVEENNLGQVVSKLRQALGEAPGDNTYIATIPGRGYRFVAETRVVEERPRDEESAAVGLMAAGKQQDPARRVPTVQAVAAFLLLVLCGSVVYFLVVRRDTPAASRVTSVA